MNVYAAEDILETADLVLDAEIIDQDEHDVLRSKLTGRWLDQAGHVEADRVYQVVLACHEQILADGAEPES